MLLRDEVYKPYTGKETAHIRGKIEIGRLITYYQSKGYVITAGSEPMDSLNPLAKDELLVAEG
jgi:hypothetical protein